MGGKSKGTVRLLADSWRREWCEYPEYALNRYRFHFLELARGPYDSRRRCILEASRYDTVGCEPQKKWCALSAFSWQMLLRVKTQHWWPSYLYHPAPAVPSSSMQLGGAPTLTWTGINASLCSISRDFLSPPIQFIIVDMQIVFAWLCDCQRDDGTVILKMLMYNYCGAPLINFLSKTGFSLKPDAQCG